LVAAFPQLFAKRTLPVEVSAMGWGFTCGDGWFPLTWRLCLDLYELIQQEPEVERAAYRAVQVKEKFGGLRLYMNRWTPAMEERIARAESESLHTCDVCGQPGSLLRGAIGARAAPTIPRRCAPIRRRDPDDVQRERGGIVSASVKDPLYCEQ
jgi:hypothetical protein